MSKPRLASDTLQELDMLLAHAKSFEWELHEGQPTCASCKSLKEKGHKPGCALQRALRNAEGFIDMQREAWSAAS